MKKDKKNLSKFIYYLCTHICKKLETNYINLFDYENNIFALTRETIYIYILPFSFYLDYEETKLFPPRVALVVQDLTKEYAGEAVVQGVNFNVSKF